MFSFRSSNQDRRKGGKSPLLLTFISAEEDFFVKRDIFYHMHLFWTNILILHHFCDIATSTSNTGKK